MLFRRCISILVIAGLFAGNLAAVPHAHPGVSTADQRRHDATPHFHCDWFARGAHDHGHSHGGHDSHSAQPRSDGNRGDDDGNSLPNGLNDTEHDANAIFVSPHAGAASITRAMEYAGSAWQFAAFDWVTECVGDVPSNPRSPPPWHPPDEALDASDTFLTLRNLRI